MLKRNLIANYIGQGWRTLMGFAFIPLYIHYLGMEAYGLIGLFAVLQTTLGILENGLNPALGREMARFTGGAHSAQSIRDLLRSIEIIIVLFAVVVAAGVWAISTWLASSWLTSENLSEDIVAQALSVMGLVISLRFLENIYSSSVLGLQRQVAQNLITGVMATMRGLGAVAILAWVSPTIEAFFLWQAFISFITTIFFAGLVYHTLPSPPRRASFSVSALIGIWRFAAGMIALTVLAVLLSQIDKILLSKVLTLEDLGYYLLATVVASALYVFTGPISNAFSPRLMQLMACKDNAAIRRIYHQGSQLICVLTGTGAMLLVIIGDRFLLVWTGDQNLVEQVSPLLSVLAIGTLFSCLILMPYHLQLASGWTSLRIWIDSVAVVITVPAVLLIVPHYGALGAAWVWLFLNAGRILINVPLMHHRLLEGEQGSWFIRDVAFPLAGALASVLVMRWVMPTNLGRLGEAGMLIALSLGVLMVSSMSSALVREKIKNLVFGKLEFLKA